MVAFIVTLSSGLNLFCISFCRQFDDVAVGTEKALIRYTSPFGVARNTRNKLTVNILTRRLFDCVNMARNWEKSQRQYWFTCFDKLILKLYREQKLFLRIKTEAGTSCVSMRRPRLTKDEWKTACRNNGQSNINRKFTWIVNLSATRNAFKKIIAFWILSNHYS